VKLTEEQKKLITEGMPAMVATADRAGKPNVSPKGSLRILDDETLCFGDVQSPRTTSNLKENPKIAILFFNPANRKGCRVWGKAEVLNSGPLFDQVSKETLERRKTVVKNVIRITIEETVAY
jgi:predicted pyridoxine 5'-phosphate oxidase superfamily flavin-nucleotide-binding protein